MSVNLNQPLFAGVLATGMDPVFGTQSTNPVEEPTYLDRVDQLVQAYSPPEAPTPEARVGFSGGGGVGVGLLQLGSMLNALGGNNAGAANLTQMANQRIGELDREVQARNQKAQADYNTELERRKMGLEARLGGLKSGEEFSRQDRRLDQQDTSLGHELMRIGQAGERLGLDRDRLAQEFVLGKMRDKLGWGQLGLEAELGRERNANTRFYQEGQLEHMDEQSRLNRDKLLYSMLQDPVQREHELTLQGLRNAGRGGTAGADGGFKQAVMDAFGFGGNSVPAPNRALDEAANGKGANARGSEAPVPTPDAPIPTPTGPTGNQPIRGRQQWYDFLARQAAGRLLGWNF